MNSLTHITFALLVTTALLSTDAQPPAPPPPQIQIRTGFNINGSRSVQINGQSRKISVSEKDETIIIEDTAGKNIKIRRIRTVDGQKKTEEFQAPDADTLKKNHPDIADIYRKHVEGAIQLQIQVPAPQRMNPGDPFGIPRNGLSRRGQGTRQITSSSKGKTVEIDDHYGEKIVIKITDRRSAEPKTRTIEADNLEDLETKDAEAAEHYRRLTAES